MKHVDLAMNGGAVIYRRLAADGRDEMCLVRAAHEALTALGFEAWVTVPASLAADLVDPIVAAQADSARRLRRLSA